MEEREMPVVFSTDEDRVKFVHDRLDNLRRDFAIRDVRSVVNLMIWCDGETGAQYHIEGDDQPKLIAWMKKVLAELEKGK